MNLPSISRTGLLCCLSLAFTLIAPTGYPQSSVRYDKTDRTRPEIGNRLFFGGDLGLQFGTVTIVNVSPLVGYRITEKLAAGVGITYQYYNDKRFTPDFSTSIYGARVFGRYFIMENLYAHAEYEVLNYDAIFVDPYNLLKKDRVTAHNVYIGGGYRLAMGEHAAIDLSVLYNINESAESLYENPVIRIGMVFGGL